MSKPNTMLYNGKKYIFRNKRTGIKVTSNERLDEHDDNLELVTQVSNGMMEHKSVTTK